jgi:hypothetical protein
MATVENPQLTILHPTIIPSPHVLPTLLILRNSLPRSICGCDEPIVQFGFHHHLMVMSVLLFAATQIPMTLEEQLGVDFMETGRFKTVHW